MNKKYRHPDKRPLSTLRPDPRHWTRKGSSWKQKVSYRSKDEAWEFLEQNPKLRAIGYLDIGCMSARFVHCIT